jgi:hypothetical protein
MFSNKNSNNKKYLIFNLIVLIIFSVFIFLSTINKKTISPSWFVDTYSPWKSEIGQNRLDTFGYKHEGHDQVMQFFFNRIDDAQTGYDENQYSIDWQMGLPKNTRVEFSNFTQKYIYNFFSYSKFGSNDLENIQIAVNLSTLVSFIICFLLIQIILNKVFKKNFENIIFSILLNPIFFLPTEEAWQMAMIGIFFFILSFLILNELKNKNKFIRIFQFIILCFLSGHFFINSMSFHYWLYPIVIGTFFSFFIFKKLGIKALWLSIGFFLAVIINSSLILETLNSLQLSPSKLSINNPLTNIKQMEYAMLPLGYFIPDIILKEVYDIIKLNFWPINSLIDIGEGFWGFPVLILSIVGFFKTRDTALKLAILLCIFYWVGPLQLLLKIFIGGPFLSETSTGGRFGAVIYLILHTLSIYTYYLIKENKIILPKFLDKINFLVFSVVILQIIYFYKLNLFWLFGFVYLGLIIIFHIFLKKKLIIILLLSICILPFYNTLSKYGKHSIYPNDTTKLNNKILSYNSFDENGVGVIASSSTQKKYIKKPIHANFLILYNLRSLNGFVTPTNRYFQVLYNYQWMTNFPGQNLNELKSSINKANLNESFLGKIKNKLKNYLNNRRKIDLNNDKNYEYILQKSHRHYTFPIPLENNKFSKETENFFDLVGVSYIFTDDKVDLNDGYDLLENKNEIKIWKRDKLASYFRLLCEFEKDTYDISSVKKLLSDQFNFEKSVIIYENLKINQCSKKSLLLKTKIDKDNKNFFIAELSEPSGILSTNFVWNNNLIATDQNNNTLKTAMCNVAFVCIVPNINSEIIYLKYQKPSLYNFIKDKYNSTYSFKKNY